MKKPLRVVAVGAAGPFAGLVVPALTKREVHVRGFVHDAKDVSKARENGCAEISVGDLADQGAVATALEGMDAAFYLSPVAMENEAEVGKEFVAAAVNAGIRRVVFSSVMRPTLSLENHAAKAPVEEALRDSGLEYTILQPAIFFQTMAAGWKKAQESGSYAEPWSNQTRFSRVDYRDVAEVAAIALTEDRLLYGTFELASEGWLNRFDVAQIMSEVLGKPVKAQQAPAPRQGQMPDQLIKMMAWYDEHGLLSNPTTLRAILGAEPRTLREYLQETKA